MKIDWGPHYMMGIPVLDQQHEEMFKVARKIMTISYEQNIRDSARRMFIIREGLKYILSYWQQHTVTEEQYMRSIQYPDYVEHKRLHDEFEEIQLQRYHRIVDRKQCSQEEILEFLGGGVGWLLEHVATADMAIVGKAAPIHARMPVINRAALEQEANLMFVSTLNVNIEPRIIHTKYAGESLGQAVYHVQNYVQNGSPQRILAGVEVPFLVSAAQIVYGQDLAELDALMMATLEMFGASFWRTFGEGLQANSKPLEYTDSHALTQKQMQALFEKKQPTLSLLFETKLGRFFIASDLWREMADA